MVDRKVVDIGAWRSGARNGGRAEETEEPLGNLAGCDYSKLPREGFVRVFVLPSNDMVFEPESAIEHPEPRRLVAGDFLKDSLPEKVKERIFGGANEVVLSWNDFSQTGLTIDPQAPGGKTLSREIRRGIQALS